MALRDEVPGDDVDSTEFGAGALLLHPAHQCGVGGHHQVLQGLCWVCADVLQVHCEINSSHKKSPCQQHNQNRRLTFQTFQSDALCAFTAVVVTKCLCTAL